MTAPADVDGVPSGFERWVRTVLFPGARLTLWVLSYLSLLLVGWVLLGMFVGRWTPVVVTSGSMEPAVSVGDVLLIDTTPDGTISQRSIVVFERSDGAVVAHRVFSAEGAELVTKGDANPSPDIERVAAADVRGVARVLVPLVGLPAVWSDQGAWIPLVAWGLLTLAGAVHFVVSLIPAMRRRRPQREPADDVGQVGVRRVRVLVAVLITAQYVLDPSRFEVFGSDRVQLPLLISLLAVLLITNALSLRLKVDRNRLPFIELTIDTALVVFLSALTGSSGLGWVLFALPIIEAAVRFGLVGALNHWMVLTTVTVATRIWTFEISGSVNLLEELEQTLDQMSVLFLVVVPGAYLAEQLVGDVAEQRRAISRVVARSELLETVAEASRTVSQLDGQHVDAVLDGTRRLGFDVVDLVITADGTTWRKFGGSPEWDLPEPGRFASGVRPEDLQYLSVIVDGDDAVERGALDDLGLSTILVSAVAVKDGGRAVLRAAIRHGRAVTAGEVDAFRLLAGQAAVALQNHELLSEITSMHVELEHQAHHDSLTGLPNRAMLLEQLDDAVRNDPRPAVMFLDLDGFKPVNDRLGHDAGDELLRLVAMRLANAAPSGSVVARVGGDEFTILIRGNVSAERAEVIAVEVVSMIAEPFEVNGEAVRIGTSIGIAFAEQGLTSAEVVRRADVAMYIAKHGDGEASHQFHRAEFDQAELRRALLADNIRQAIIDQQITMHFQPIVRVSGSHEIAGLEALVRWEHPELGSIPAPETVAAARMAKAGSMLHRWIVRSSIGQVAEWLRDGHEDALFLTINASPDDLAADYLVPNLVDAIAELGVDANRLFVEISEQLVSPHAPGVMDNISALNRAGVRMLLDDFGEGQTSISYIHELPVAGIKLDRKLVVNAIRSRTDQIVIESIVDLCRRLGLVVIAEGIETPAHQAVVEQAGCSLAQGYYTGMPQDGDRTRALLRGQPLATADVTVVGRS